MVALDKCEETTCSFLFYLFCRDQVSSAVRLGICGPVEGQRVLKYLLGYERGVLDLAFEESEPIKTAPAWEVAQSSHSRIYSTLFQN